MRRGWVALLLLTACEVQAPDSPAAKPQAPASGPPPEVAIVVRAGLLPGRPVPYRLTIKNGTGDVLIPVSAEATEGVGVASFFRPVLGKISYDRSSDRYLENAVALQSSKDVLYRTALQPGEAMVEEMDVRYPRAGTVTEKVNLLFQRLSPAQFDSLVYVGASDSIPRVFEPVGMISDKSAREGALLSGFYLRLSRLPESADTTIEVVLPEVPPAVAARIRTAGLDPGAAIAASWSGGWVAGDTSRSILVTGDQTKPLAGVPIDVIRMIDGVDGDVPFCVTGASREEIAPVFQGYDIVPHNCLHVSVPRVAMMRILGKIGSSGYAVRVSDNQYHAALDVFRPGAADRK